MSLTHGPAGLRQHIWSFVGAEYEQHPNYHTYLNCPCTNTNIFWPYQLPLFINNNYFCDTGNLGPGTSSTTYYTDDPLWDGKGCGMVRDVAVQAPAVSSTLLRGSISLYPSLQVMTWR